jgi:hypothetical protein
MPIPPRLPSSILWLPVLLGVVLLSLAGSVAAQPTTPPPTPDGRGLEPDLSGQSNGRIRGEQVFLAGGVEHLCIIYEGTKVSSVRLGAEYWCYDELNWKRLVALSEQIPGPAPVATISGRLDLPEPRGALSADLVAAFGRLQLVYGSPRADDSNVNRQEVGGQETGVAVLTGRRELEIRSYIPVRAELTPILGPTDPEVQP